MKRGQQGKAGRSGFGSPAALGAAGGAFSGAAAGSSLSYLAEPPSFSAVSDPNVVVSLKNVLKKDSITKAKALEDLLQHVQAHPFDQGGGVDEALLDVWVRPPTSVPVWPWSSHIADTAVSAHLHRQLSPGPGAVSYRAD